MNKPTILLALALCAVAPMREAFADAPAESLGTIVTAEQFADYVSYSNGVLTVNGQTVEIAAPQTAPEPKRIAMFIIPVNNETDTVYTGFELKASTNNFRYGASEYEKLQFYGQSERADSRAYGDHRDWDYMRLYACLANSAPGWPTAHTPDPRAYERIKSTRLDYGLNASDLKYIVVLIDEKCLYSHPDGDWLRDDNDDLVWCYYRTKPNNAGEGRWRPIAPVRWFATWPSWAGDRENF